MRNSQVKIGNKWVGDGHPTFVIAEIGINHNGDINLAKKLIEASTAIGCDAVKFQKRTVEVVYSAEELAKPRENPFGPTNGDLKRGLEFGKKEYDIINAYCQERDIMWFASCWDKQSIDFIDTYNVPCYKIASASLTDDTLLQYTKSKGKPIILSTGMSTLDQIDHAVSVLGKDNLIILHCTSTYPSKTAELNLNAVTKLKDRYGVPIGYSGHETGLVPSVIACAEGACVIERHITLDRAMWGSDQAASVEIHGFARLVRDIRLIPEMMGDGNKIVYESEIPILKKLRRV
ncbi:MAG: N-acetylneuraminate synthase [Candidatus Omnitrophica bacterium CG11_big_fil_rev_8_21_14_0_20_45_26]|uniref:N-acetylneuraminate synthase n=1 Tax=Candidatus Abzuiibacterium crystallinum TaxID=1974748 RepID=A0A2H0LPF3_9BACT|nr:MAG: N-acetylneuraminate synthase [Candidatus Omnitrophica bacterium CG11_big_fil_rev_8_21_14_0_20_45_26]PIW63267.1 MAG: N-acetylneuraminate synthase [Candidatus Omnitrophica bacterium CG12_big_fil_rev_8_21_14_0_65_45_16]